MRRRKRQRTQTNVRTNTRTNVRVPSAQSVKTRNRGALRNLRIKHTEFIQNLQVQELKGANQITKFEIQPGNSTTFPWLSAIARLFESYRFNSLSFEYIPDVGTTTDGSIALCPDYDASDDNSQATRAKLLVFEDSVRGPLWSRLKCNSTKRNLEKRKTYYTRGDTQPTGTDLKLYDTGNLWTTMNYNGEAATVGEVWVTYDITLSTPQLESTQAYQFTSSHPVEPAMDPVKPFYNLAPHDNVVSLMEDNTWNTLRFFKPGIYLLTYLIDRFGAGGGSGDQYNPLYRLAPTVYQAQGDSSITKWVHGLSSDTDDSSQPPGTLLGETLKYFINVGNETSKAYPTLFSWLSTAQSAPWTTALYNQHLRIEDVGEIPAVPLGKTIKSGTLAQYQAYFENNKGYRTKKKGKKKPEELVAKKSVMFGSYE